jgi:CheY-like chemotaxis protein
MATILVVDDDRVVSHLVGAKAVLSKPLVPEELFQALEAAL